ncbi:arrestin domain-containing protein 3 [Calliopsis andreniformis]|uniref:arrestin domain-containing protein 3 n=1 Tax=Calliopsis andreniformis TaxID=337506 RepID=UPI003FCDCDBA
MSSLTKFCVEFDRPGAIYTAGEIVTGNIVVELCKSKNLRGLYLSAKGLACVQWNESRTERNSQGHTVTHSDTYSNNEKYFNFEFSLLGARKSDIQVDIPPGHHRYPFTFHLPQNIPSSFEHPIGYVRYTVKGVMDRPWRFDHECKAAFTVLSILNLNLYQQKCLGVDDETSKNFCCFCCIDLGSLNVRVRLPTLGYVPGQRINTIIDYVNSSSTVQVTTIETRFEQLLKFHSTSKSTTTRCTVTSSKIAAPTTTKAQTVSELLLPPIPPSYLEFCNIIDIEYTLKIIVHVSGAHWAVNKQYPAIVGTIPLLCPPSAPPQNAYNPEVIANKSSEMHIPMPMPPTAPCAPDDQPSNSGIRDAPQSIGFVHPNQPGFSNIDYQIPPPSYEECMTKAQNIKDNGESNYVHGANDSFAPRYPVFNYPTPSNTTETII